MSHTHRAPLFVVFKLPVMEQQERRLGSHVYADGVAWCPRQHLPAHVRAQGTSRQAVLCC